MTDLNEIAEDIIFKQVGIKPGAGNRTPVDYEECKLCIISALSDSGLVKALQEIIEVGHNNDCMFCGFKDRIATKALAGINEQTKEK